MANSWSFARTRTKKERLNLKLNLKPWETVERILLALCWLTNHFRTWPGGWRWTWRCRRRPRRPCRTAPQCVSITFNVTRSGRSGSARQPEILGSVVVFFRDWRTDIEAKWKNTFFSAKGAFCCRTAQFGFSFALYETIGIIFFRNLDRFLT